MKITIDTEVLWGEIRRLNEKSYMYSEMAQNLLKLTKELEGDSLDEN